MPGARQRRHGGQTTTRRYGHRRSQVADLWLPAGVGPHPVVVVLHGGFWKAAYGRRLMSRISADLAARGWAAWNLEYRRVGGGGGWPATFADVAAGIDAVAGLPGVDPCRVSTVGHSAGGQLALWAAARPGLPPGSPGATPAVRVGAAVSLGGVVDLVVAADGRVGGNAVARLLGGPPGAVPDRYGLASPAARLPLGVPQLLVHGEDDATVPPELSRRYAEMARLAGDDVDLCIQPGVGHMDVIDPGSRAWATVIEWMDRHPIR